MYVPDVSWKKSKIPFLKKTSMPNGSNKNLSRETFSPPAVVFEAMDFWSTTNLCFFNVAGDARSMIFRVPKVIS